MPDAAPHSQLKLAHSVGRLAGVGQARQRLLNRIGIHTLSDLLRHLPARYERHAAEGAISQLVADTIGSARGEIAACRWVPAMGRHKKGRLEATLKDDTDRLKLTWFNANYLRERLQPGMSIRVQGKVSRFGEYLQMVNPRHEVLNPDDDPPAHDARLRPIYPATEDLPSAVIEKIIADALPLLLPLVIHPLPAELLEHHAMPGLADAYAMVHQPDHEQQAQAARRRLAFNELLLLQLGIALKRAYVSEQLVAPALKFNPAIDQHIRQRFAFTLTPAQERVVREIADDLSRPRPMNRLLQGDVGSGKTVVALHAMLLAAANRRQAALMAPTELLAEQHALGIGRMLEGSKLRIELLTANQPPPGADQRKALLADIARGAVDLVIGTHALLSESVRFHDLGLIVIDEQHRFGVEQRSKFRAGTHGSGEQDLDEKGRRRVPHHLVMTATPIPRTLSLTIFGDLDVSTIDQLPPGRTPITNRVVGMEKTDEVYRYLAERVAKGQQAYVLVPAIDAESQDRETAAQLRNVSQHTKLLQQKFLPDYKVAAVHGRLKRDTRQRIMDRFREGEIQVLVATTVIEVGVDVPNATVMVIEHAERFGLAQLHQLRGRVGRSATASPSLCVFVAQPTTDAAQQRLTAIASTNDGFKIAELDLQIRGMGDFFGTRQAGLPPLRVASIPEDMDLLNLARRDAMKLIEVDARLDRPEHRSLRRILLQQYGQTLGLIDVG